MALKERLERDDVAALLEPLHQPMIVQDLHVSAGTTAPAVPSFRGAAPLGQFGCLDRLTGVRTPVHLTSLLVLALTACESYVPPFSSFEWEVAPNNVEVQPGGTATFHISISSKENINSD